MGDSDYCRVHRMDLPRMGGAPAGNRNRRIHGLYGKYITPDDMTALAVVGTSVTLDDEIAFIRVVLRRLADLASQAGTIEEACRLASTLFTGTGQVAHLLRAQQALTGQTADTLATAIASALDELGEEWGLQL
jgi:hypothetical protein